MELEAQKLLHDVRGAIRLIEEFTAGHSVERQFIIVGEATGQLARAYPEVAAQITDAREIIDFRNLLTHGYTLINDRVVWETARDDLPTLRGEVEALLDEE